ncbi:MAG: metal-sensing transcriptional repressor [Selenomonadaceae bacterium]|nr:metal-sensing transcriptional repressor [Selenomonadaceae bacterium]
MSEKDHQHPHTHPHKHTKAVLKRISTISGHLHGIAGMIEEGRDCSEVLVQLSAVSAAIKKLKVVILKDHFEHCLVDAVETGDAQTLDKMYSAMDRLLD